MDIKLDDNGDIDTSRPDLQHTSGLDAKIQHLKQRLRMFFGEWFLDLRRGVPYFQYILKKDADPVVVDAVLKKEIIDTPGITELRQFSLDLDDRTRVLTASFKAQTQEGEINFEEALP